MSIHTWRNGDQDHIVVSADKPTPETLERLLSDGSVCCLCEADLERGQPHHDRCRYPAIRMAWAEDRRLLDQYRLWRMKAEQDLADLKKELDEVRFIFACAVAERGLLTIEKGTMMRLQKNPTVVRVDGEARVVFTVDHTRIAGEE